MEHFGYFLLLITWYIANQTEYAFLFVSKYRMYRSLKISSQQLERFHFLLKLCIQITGIFFSKTYFTDSLYRYVILSTIICFCLNASTCLTQNMEFLSVIIPCFLSVRSTFPTGGYHFFRPHIFF